MLEAIIKRQYRFAIYSQSKPLNRLHSDNLIWQAN